MNSSLVWVFPKILYCNENLTDSTMWHRAWLQLSKKPVCLVDCTGTSKNFGDNMNIKYILNDYMPYHCTVPNYENGRYWHNNFSELMQKLSNDIFDRCKNYNELRLSYSGGTDSSTALIALLSNPRIKDYLQHDRFVIYTTSYAKVENFPLWDKIIQLNIPLRFLDYDLLNQDQSNHFMITGDGDGYGTWWQMLKDRNKEVVFSEHEIFFASLSDVKPKLSKWFLTLEPSGVCWEYFNAFITTSPLPIDNLHQAWNYFENSCAGQCFMFRLSAYGAGNVNITPNKNWYWFMGNQEFYDLVEYEAREKIYTTDETQKFQCLKYISDYLGLADVQLKSKFFSQRLVPKIINKFQIFQDSVNSSTFTYTGHYVL